MKGRVIELEHNVSSPQPYDRINLIAGTKGIFRDYPPRIYLDGAAKEDFGPLDPYKKKSTSIPTGRRLANWRARWAATAAWIS